MFSKWPKKLANNWATFVTKIVTKNVKNHPIRSHFWTYFWGKIGKSKKY